MNVSWIWERTGRFAQESRLREKNQRFFGPKEVNTNGKAARQSEPLSQNGFRNNSRTRFANKLMNFTNLAEVRSCRSR